MLFVGTCHYHFCCRQVIAARSIDQLNITAEECRQFSADVHVVQADVGVEEDCKAVVEKAVEELGGVDILILNAALSPSPQLFSTMDKPVSGLC